MVKKRTKKRKFDVCRTVFPEVKKWKRQVREGGTNRLPVCGEWKWEKQEVDEGTEESKRYMTFSLYLKSMNMTSSY